MNVAIVIPLCGMLPFTFGEGPGPIPFRVSDEFPILRDRYSPPMRGGIRRGPVGPRTWPMTREHSELMAPAMWGKGGDEE